MTLGIIADIALIVVFALTCYIYTKRGFLYALTVITGKFVSLLLAFFFSKYLTFIFEPSVGKLWEKTGKLAEICPWVVDIICTVLAFIVCVIIVRLVFWIIAKLTSGIEGKLGTANHVLGFIAGLLIAFIGVQILAVVIFVVAQIVGIANPKIATSVVDGSILTEWVVEHNILIDLIKSIAGKLLSF